MDTIVTPTDDDAVTYPDATFRITDDGTLEVCLADDGSTIIAYDPGTWASVTTLRTDGLDITVAPAEA